MIGTIEVAYGITHSSHYLSDITSVAAIDTSKQQHMRTPAYQHELKATILHSHQHINTSTHQHKTSHNVEENSNDVRSEFSFSKIIKNLSLRIEIHLSTAYGHPHSLLACLGCRCVDDFVGVSLCRCDDVVMCCGVNVLMC